MAVVKESGQLKRPYASSVICREGVKGVGCRADV